MLTHLRHVCIQMIVVAGSVVGVNHASAQNTETILEQIRELTSQKKLDEALHVVTRQLVLYPDDYDLLMAQARIHGWQRNFGIANVEIADIIFRWPNNRDALELKIDILYWAEDFEDMLSSTEEALLLFPASFEFQYKRIIALEQSGSLAEATERVNEILKTHPGDGKLLSLKKSIADKTMKNGILVSYRFSGFDRTLENWHNTTVSYSRNTKIGSLIGSLNYGNQFSVSAMQYEADFYPKFSRKFYSYVNVGFSNGKIFPVFRGGLELYYTSPFSCEFSAGMRYLKYRSDDVFIYTGTLGVYPGNYWLMARPTIIQLGNKQSFTIGINARKYLSGKDHYVGLSLGRGNAPTYFVSLQEIQRLLSIQEGIEYQVKINSTITKIFVGHQKEEYIDGQFRNRFSAEVSLTRRL